MLFAIPLRHCFIPDAASRTQHPAGRVPEEDRERPDRHVLEQPGWLSVVCLAALTAFRALGLAVTPWLAVNDQCIKTANGCQPAVTVNERLERSTLFSTVLISIVPRCADMIVSRKNHHIHHWGAMPLFSCHPLPTYSAEKADIERGASMATEKEKKELKALLVNIFGGRARDWDLNEDSVTPNRQLYIHKVQFRYPTHHTLPVLPTAGRPLQDHFRVLPTEK